MSAYDCNSVRGGVYKFRKTRDGVWEDEKGNPVTEFPGEMLDTKVSAYEQGYDF